MKVGVVGAGLVGSTCAYAMVMRGIGREVVLVDRNEKRACAEAEDIFHAVPFAHPMKIASGGYSALAGCRVVVLAAGVSQRPGESRLELLKRNAEVFRDIVPQVLTHAPHAVLLVVSNPVDIMTHLAARFAAEHGVAAGRVLGSGTTLDTARFRVLLGNHLQVDSNHVHAYVLGEHGDSEVLTWSLVTIGGTPLHEFCAIERCSSHPHLPHTHVDDSVKQQIDDRVRQAAYRIIDGKGATYYGIGSAVANIVGVILRDQRSILTVTTPHPEVEGVSNVSISLPRLLGGDGVLATIHPPLVETEREALRYSALVVRKAIEALDA